LLNLKQELYLLCETCLGNKLIAAQKADRIFRPLINIIIFMAFAVAVSELIFFQHTIYKVQWFNLSGFIMFTVGLFVYLKARHNLGRFFSEKLRIANNHKIVNKGIYRVIRHPIYLGGILLLPGATLVLNSIIGFFVMLPYIVVILLRISFEEKILIETFDQQYIEYTKKTSRLLPYIY